MNTANLLRDWCHAILEHFDDHITDPTQEDQ